MWATDAPTKNLLHSVGQNPRLAGSTTETDRKQHLGTLYGVPLALGGS